tara:strand:- start:3445 stop:4695 length:1251 start_codon:yes stop_codon:yes gene_type:complete
MIKKLKKIGTNAKKAAEIHINNKTKNKVLNEFAFLLDKNRSKIISENKKDVLRALKIGLKKNLIKRLELDGNGIDQIISTVKKISKLKDPVNNTLSKWKVPNGLKIKRVTIPIGVIGVIYESRPNVTSDISCLCFKSGNSVILKGGSEAYFSNLIISELFRNSLKKYKIDKNYIQFIKMRERKVVRYMLSKMKEFIDVIIPRGGKNLVKTVQDFSSIPTIGHLEGVCHTYVDKSASLEMAKKIVFNAKMRNTSICGATETLLIHKKVLNKFINPILSDLEQVGCKIYADSLVKKFYKGNSQLAKTDNWGKEYLSSAISVKCVNNVSDAIYHVNRYGTMHTDAIITRNNKVADKFLKNVKSSIAIHNSSTQFADGGEFGFGGEVGISTNKLPPRGPVGLSKLVTYKYEVQGSGQVRN